MAQAKKARKTSAPAPKPKKAPHELLWEAGQGLYEALQKYDEEARDRLAAASQEQQQNLWNAQLAAQRRAEELRQDYWSALEQATGEDSQQVYQEATQAYLDALGEAQGKFQAEWEAAGSSYQKTFSKLQEVFHLNRLTAFSDYKHACQKVWSELDPKELSCEDLATIGQSLWMGAHLMGGRPHGS